MEGVPVEEVRKVDEEKGDDKIDKLTVENNDDLSQSQNCQKKDEDGGGSSSATPPLLSTTAMTEEEDSVTFHCVSYLGASKIQDGRKEEEIQKMMAFLNENAKDTAIQVSVAVPFHSDGYVVVYEEANQEEISRFKVNQIIFFARGDQEAPCFAFTCAQGEPIPIFQCHAFRCDVPEAVGRVFESFGRAFAAPPKESLPREDISKEEEMAFFEVSLEFKEDDGKGNYSSVPRDKGVFKLRSLVPKHIVVTVQQVGDGKGEFIVERCFGLLLSPGRHVRHSDMHLVERLSWSIGSVGASDRKSYVVTGGWDPNDPAFQPLNEETAKDSYVFLTVAVDLIIKGIREPIRFVVETKAKVYPTAERFWMIGRKHHVTQQFELSVKRLEGAKGEVVGLRHLGEIDKNKLNFNLNFTSFIRSSSIGSLELETPTKDEEESDDDEPLQSGVGEISKHCSDEQIAAWSDIMTIWPVGSPTRPKQLGTLVRAGIPDTVRGEMWLRLANFEDDEDTRLFEAYKCTLQKECSNDDVISRDINRTFPANDYFKESGGNGQEQLFRISRGYAVYDAEVGYCQGISFIAAALLLQMPEEQAFSLLVKIMFSYGFRDLYRDGFDNLHATLYQLDKLIEEHIPELSTHFQELGIESHMYASQWFLTCFCGKFPLVFVFRVVDLFLLDGFKTLFQVAIALLAAARKDLLVLDFEGVLKYFRVNLPKKYRNVDATNVLMGNAVRVKVKRLKKYLREYKAIKEQERNYVDPVTRLTHENKKLMEDIMRYEYTVTNLVLTKASAEETCAGLEEELSRTKMSLKELEDFNARLKEETNSVKELFQKEVKQFDTEGEKKANIITEYKQICSKLSSQLEIEQKLSRERMHFFQTNLCSNCANFVSTAMNLAGTRKMNGEPGSFGDRMSPDEPNGQGQSLEELVKPLENELAKTKIALAESECRNDDLSHRLTVALAALENSKSSSGSTWLWKNLSFAKEKDHKKTPSQAHPEDSSSAPNASSASSSTSASRK